MCLQRRSARAAAAQRRHYREADTSDDEAGSDDEYGSCATKRPAKRLQTGAHAAQR